MRHILRFTVLLLLIVFHSSAFAQSVFQCKGDDGEMTFSFAPCAAPEPKKEPPAPVVIEPMIAEEQEVDAVALDSRIETLQLALDELRIEHAKAMESTARDVAKLTAEYNRKSASIVEELMQLYQDRQQFAAR